MFRNELRTNKHEHEFGCMRRQIEHYAGGNEVWVFDAVKQKRLSRIKLIRQGHAIEITQGDQPHLVVAMAEGVDVYDAKNGKFLRHIGGQGVFSALHASSQ